MACRLCEPIEKQERFEVDPYHETTLANFFVCSLGMSWQPRITPIRIGDTSRMQKKIQEIRLRPCGFWILET